MLCVFELLNCHVKESILPPTKGKPFFIFRKLFSITMLLPHKNKPNLVFFAFVLRLHDVLTKIFRQHFLIIFEHHHTCHCMIGLWQYHCVIWTNHTITHIIDVQMLSCLYIITLLKKKKNTRIRKRELRKKKRKQRNDLPKFDPASLHGLWASKSSPKEKQVRAKMQ